MALNLSFINSKEIEMLYKLLDIKKHVQQNVKLTLEASLTGGPKVSQQTEKVERDFDIVEKLYAVWDHLNNGELIDYLRPNSIKEITGDDLEFAFEEVEAHKLYFPKNRFSEVDSLEHLVVWVAEPDPKKLSNNILNYGGTFLYLVEASFDGGPYKTTLSGCSALQAISNAISGKSFYTINGQETLGRYNSQHPIKKLEAIGAVYLQKQKIKVLYRKRYITDEQCFMYQSEKFRCNDLLAYPLFIS